jgi:hypothetical protein
VDEELAKRLERIEIALGQIGYALRQCSGWHPAHAGQTELSDFLQGHWSSNREKANEVGILP